ncbi:MAG: T9SS type A sorting domain-containing protein, partial [candidate division WOR-3 bacterium]
CAALAYNEAAKKAELTIQPGLQSDVTEGKAAGFAVEGPMEGATIQFAILKQWNFQVFNSHMPEEDTKDGLRFFDWLLSSQDNIDIYAARVTADGALLDTNGFAVAWAPGVQAIPVATFDGANYVVGWTDMSGAFPLVYVARITPSGVLLDTGGIRMGLPNAPAAYPGLASDGTNTLVTWTDVRNGRDPDVYCARLNQAGKVLDSVGIPVSRDYDYQWFSNATYDGEQFLVVWEDYRTGDTLIYCARVTPQGVVLDPDGIEIDRASGTQIRIPVTFDGTHFVTAWTRYDQAGLGDIFGARINRLGRVVETFPIAVRDEDEFLPGLATNSNLQTFLTYSGFAGNVGNHDYNTWRIWGSLDALGGIESRASPQPSPQTIRLASSPCSGVLRVRAAFLTPGQSISVLDASGREVTRARVQTSHEACFDLSRVPSGVYFVRCPPPSDRRPDTSDTRFILVH